VNALVAYRLIRAKAEIEARRWVVPVEVLTRQFAAMKASKR
jgi:hypothetical protein